MENRANKGNKGKQFRLKYLVKSSLKIHLFGNKFVKNNKDKCYLIINNNECELKDIYNFKEKGEQTIILVIKEEILNFEEMFYFAKFFLKKIVLYLNHILNLVALIIII